MRGPFLGDLLRREIGDAFGREVAADHFADAGDIQHQLEAGDRFRGLFGRALVKGALIRAIFEAIDATANREIHVMLLLSRIDKGIALRVYLCSLAWPEMVS